MHEEFVKPVKSIDEISSPPEGGFYKIHDKPPQQEKRLSQTPRRSDAHAASEINNTNRNFKGQQKNEIVLSFCRKHWIVVVPRMILFIFLLIAPFLMLIGITSFKSGGRFIDPLLYKIFIGAAILAITYYLHRCFISFFNYYLQMLIITNLRVIYLDQTLYFNRNRDSLDLHEIQDVVLNQEGIMKTFLNYGEVTITLSSAHASKTFTCVPNPEYYFRKINKTKRQYIMTRRFEKDSLA